GLGHLVNRLRPEGIAHLRPVKGDAGHAVCLVVGNIFVFLDNLPISHSENSLSYSAVIKPVGSPCHSGRQHPCSPLRAGSPRSVVIGERHLPRTSASTEASSSCRRSWSARPSVHTSTSAGSSAARAARRASRNAGRLSTRV